MQLEFCLLLVYSKFILFVLGKALCLLTRNDLSERSPGAGDVLHNVLQLLIRDATILQRCLPSSPVTPTSRHAYPLSPHSHPSTPSWNVLSSQNGDAFHHGLAAHLMIQNNSVTLSPAPSIDSQASSPQHADTQNQLTYGHTTFSTSNGSGSNQSDSEEDSYQEQKYQDMQNGHSSSPPNTPGVHALSQQMPQGQPPKSPKEDFKDFKDFKDIASKVAAFRPVAREFFPVDSPEPNTSKFKKLV